MHILLIIMHGQIECMIHFGLHTLIMRGIQLFSVVCMSQVPFSRSSLNHDDVFILDTASKIFLFSGCNSSIQERAKALDVVQYIKENRHGGKCDVATIGWDLFCLSSCSFFFQGKDIQANICSMLQRMESLLVILTWVNSGVYLVVLLPFLGTRLLLSKKILIILL